MLLLAATPIGNLGDASPRLREALASARFIAAEDTRNVRHLAQALGIRLEAELISLHEHNESDRIEKLLELARHGKLLVVSDAGMPTISDPGFLLVQAAAASDIAVSVIPGPSAVLGALAVSGLATDRFCFEGFLPRKPSARRKALRALLGERRTMVFFESPHRLQESLGDLAETFGAERRAAVVRELTKKFEEVKRGGLGELSVWASAEIRGELVLVVAGAEEAPAPSETDLLAEVDSLMANGLSRRDAVAQVAAKTGASKSALYRASLG